MFTTKILKLTQCRSSILVRCFSRNKASEIESSTRIIDGLNVLKSAVLCLISISLLSGCLIETPYYGQQFDSSRDEIPLQAWTNHDATPVRVECSTTHAANRFSNGMWISVASLTPQQPGVLDSDGNRIYSVGSSLRLPQNCWRGQYVDGRFVYGTSIRMVQTKPKLLSSGYEDIIYWVFNKQGLECLGRENGKVASWYGFIGKGCERRPSGSSTPTQYIIISADSY